ncbi:MAG: hypothetical protein AB7N91_11515 [Candidatus Tectimicrobiota bacterium]
MDTVLIPPEPQQRQTTYVTTSLYELIEVLQDTVGPDDDTLVVATVAHLLASRRITRPDYTWMSQCN